MSQLKLAASKTRNHFGFYLLTLYDIVCPLMAIDPGLLQAVLPPNMADRWKGDLASLDQNQFLLLATGHMGTAQNEMLWEAHLDDNDIALKKIYNHMYILLYTILYIYIV